MQETGFINRTVADIIASLGHLDEMIVTDAGFPIPLGVRSVDISWAADKPLVTELLEEIKKHFSIEKVVMANELRENNPARFKDICAIFGESMPIEMIPHAELKQRSKGVKGIIRTGDFIGNSNVLLVSGGGNRWHG